MNGSRGASMKLQEKVFKADCQTHQQGKSLQ
jgi:hypothetical protein